MSLSARAAKIKAVICDVDGVMTDGAIGFSAQGIVKFFNVRDGHAIKMALRAGLLVGVLSGRDDAVTRQRAEELGMSFIHVGQKRKLDAFAKILEEFALEPEECCYVGDDVVDIPVMRQVGLAVCVADADPELQPYSHWRTELGGGRGAVREVLFRLLREQNKWQEAMARYVEA